VILEAITRENIPSFFKFLSDSPISSKAKNEFKKFFLRLADDA
jgi:hypothetical protein